jgi:hypothetical protein
VLMSPSKGLAPNVHAYFQYFHYRQDAVDNAL